MAMTISGSSRGAARANFSMAWEISTSTRLPRTSL